MKPPPPSMRPRNEIQRAHDSLRVALFDLGMLSAEERDPVSWMLDALCWVLEHDHNRIFADTLARIENRIT